MPDKENPEPTPLPGTIGFSQNAATDTPVPVNTDGPQIGKQAAYRNVSEHSASSYEVATAEQAVAPEPVKSSKPKNKKTEKRG